MHRNRFRQAGRLVLLLGALALWQAESSSLSQEQTRSPFAPAPDWRPTHAPAGAEYAGTQTCARCHSEALTQPSTPMARALERAADGRILSRHPLLGFRLGPYTWTIRRSGSQSIYSVTDGQDTISVPLAYAFGQGKAGQTFVFMRNGSYYESRVSFYNEIQGLDLTLGAPREVPKSLEEAAGHLMSPADARDCFSCHATAAVSSARLQTELMTAGVTCEGCHGPGAKHVQLMTSRRQNESGAQPAKGATAIFNPGRLDTNEMSEFCGACHRTWTQVQLMRMQGVGNVRFQPYRIFNSRCYDFEDKRISCTACHNPHEELKTDAAWYDAKCTACHQARQTDEKSFPVCSTGRENCSSCHMPKYEVPGSHFRFTDHQIRIVRPGEAYPN